MGTEDGLRELSSIPAVQLHAQLIVVLCVEAAMVSRSSRFRFERFALLIDSRGDLFAATEHAVPTMLGQSPCMQTLRMKLHRVARIERPTLISGETGTGKELVARNLHAMSARKHRPFVTVHCGAIPDNLVESELFGHERGSFTGASQRRKGLVHRAANGTLFLDEVNSLSITAQSKLLRFLESGEYRPVGIDTPEISNAWIVSASNEDLDKRVDEQTFRVDLLHRLNAVALHIPPLRSRGDDVLLLAGYFKQQVGGSHLRFTEAARRAIRAHSWQGNVRELRNRVESAVLLSGDRDFLDCDALDLADPEDESSGNLRGKVGQRDKLEQILWSLIKDDDLTMAQVLKHCETSVIKAALQAEGQSRARAAARLGIHVRTIFKKLSKA